MIVSFLLKKRIALNIIYLLFQFCWVKKRILIWGWSNWLGVFS